MMRDRLSSMLQVTSEGGGQEESVGGIGASPRAVESYDLRWTSVRTRQLGERVAVGRVRNEPGRGD